MATEYKSIAMLKVLVFRVRYDLASEYMNGWLERVVSYARERSYEVIDLSGPDATLENFLAALEEKPDLVIIGTHGDTTRVVGDLESSLLNSCENDGVLAGSAVVYGTCLSGQVLAKTTREKGAPVVVGYVNSYTWPIDPRAQSPVEDKIAQPFGELYVEPILAMLDGLDPKQVYERTMAKYNEVYAQLIRRDPGLDAAFATTALENNRAGLIIYGEEGVLTAPPPPMWPVYVLLGGMAATFLYLWRKPENYGRKS
jgi:hypothetical protein